MAADLSTAHAQALDNTRTLVAGVKPDQWDDQSDCDEWSVRELVNHIVTGNFWANELMGGKTIAEVGDKLDGDVLGADPSAAYDESAKAADAAFKADGAMDAPAAVSYGPVPGSIYCGHRFIDVLVHGWDVAKSTGQNTTLPPDLVDACLEVIEPQKEALLGSGAFGHEAKVATGADHQTQLLAILGREA
jgi:uncharacterized protein (TIGR03086 family)